MFKLLYGTTVIATVFLLFNLSGCKTGIHLSRQTNEGGIPVVGKVSKKVFGGAYALKADGSKRYLYYRSKIHTGEIVELPKSNLSSTTIRLLDNTKIQLTGGSRMVVEKMEYNPENRKGSLIIRFENGGWRLVNSEGRRISKDATLIILPGGTLVFPGGDIYGVVTEDGFAAKAVEGKGIWISDDLAVEVLAGHGLSRERASEMQANILSEE